MGFLILLRFALLCIDFLAWPVIALGLPLFASIRAIETGSMYHMRKLVSYWILFSIISLFEYIFVKIIEWIPFWSSVKLVAILWLVIPRFHGAYYAYQSFVHPFLVVNLQEAIDRLYKLKEQQTRSQERFLDLAEKYVQENGSAALEKLIATKMELKEPGNSQKYTQVMLEPDEKIFAAAPKQINEPETAQKDKEMLEAHEITSPEAKQRNCKEADSCHRDTQLIELNTKNDEARSKQLKEPVAARKDNEMSEASETIVTTEVKQALPVTTSNLVTKETTYAADVSKGILGTSPTQTFPENSYSLATPATPPPKKLVQRKWTCPLCQVTTTCENNLNDHIRGKNHKAMVKSLKLSKLNAAGAGPGKSAGPERGGVTRHWCFACDVELVGSASLASHLNGKRHASNIVRVGIN